LSDLSGLIAIAAGSVLAIIRLGGVVSFGRVLGSVLRLEIPVAGVRETRWPLRTERVLIDFVVGVSSALVLIVLLGSLGIGNVFVVLDTILLSCLTYQLLSTCRSGNLGRSGRWLESGTRRLSVATSALIVFLAGVATATVLWGFWDVYIGRVRITPVLAGASLLTFAFALRQVRRHPSLRIMGVAILSGTLSFLVLSPLLLSEYYPDGHDAGFHAILRDIIGTAGRIPKTWQPFADSPLTYQVGYDILVAFVGHGTFLDVESPLLSYLLGCLFIVFLVLGVYFLLIRFDQASSYSLGFVVLLSVANLKQEQANLAMAMPHRIFADFLAVGYFLLLDLWVRRSANKLGAAVLFPSVVFSAVIVSSHVVALILFCANVLLACWFVLRKGRSRVHNLLVFLLPLALGCGLAAPWILQSYIPIFAGGGHHFGVSADLSRIMNYPGWIGIFIVGFGLLGMIATGHRLITGRSLNVTTVLIFFWALAALVVSHVDLILRPLWDFRFPFWIAVGASSVPLLLMAGKSRLLSAATRIIRPRHKRKLVILFLASIYVLSMSQYFSSSIIQERFHGNERPRLSACTKRLCLALREIDPAPSRMLVIGEPYILISHYSSKIPVRNPLGGATIVDSGGDRTLAKARQLMIKTSNLTLFSDLMRTYEIKYVYVEPQAALEPTSALSYVLQEREWCIRILSVGDEAIYEIQLLELERAGDDSR